MIRRGIIVHIIFFLWIAVQLYGQSFSLRVTSENEANNEVINRLGFQENHPHLQSIYKEVNNLKLSLNRSGYLSATIDSVMRVSDSLFVGYVTLSTLTKTHRIDYTKVVSKTYMAGFTKDEWVLTDSIVQIPFEDTELFLNRVTAYFEGKGNVFAQVQLQHIKLQDGVMESTLSVTNSQTRRIDDWMVKGYKKFPTSFIHYGTRLKKGVVYKRQTVAEVSLRLNELGFVKEIKPPEVLFTNDSTIVFLYLERVKSNYFDGFLGFTSDKETNRLRLNGYVNVKLLNNLNAGEELILNWKNNGEAQTYFSVNATLPYIAKLPFGFEAGLSIVKQDSTFSNTITGLSLHYNRGLHAVLRAGIEQVESNSLLAAGAENAVDFNSFFYKIQFRQRVREIDRPLLGEKALADIQLFTGNRKHDGTRTAQQKISTDVQYLFQLDGRNYIFLRNATQGLFSDSYFNSERFWTGGIASLRGFSENSIPATFFTITNAEYRYALSPSLYINSITDVGYVQDRLLGAENTLYGLGFGMGALTAGGFLKINYALGKFKGNSFKLSEANVHLSFSTFF